MDCRCIMQTLCSHIIICCVCVRAGEYIYFLSSCQGCVLVLSLPLLCALFYKLVSLRLLHTWFGDWFSVEAPINDSSNGTFSSSAELSVTEN